MKKLRIYIDTSVIGGCFDEEFRKWSLGLFDDFKNNIFRPVISRITSFEINKGAPDFVKEKYSELLNFNVEILENTEEADKLSGLYIKRHILSSNYMEDALHIAIATVAEVDILVSWNFKHIVHFDKINQFNAVNLENGYKQIQIFSPREVTSHE